MDRGILQALFKNGTESLQVLNKIEILGSSSAEGEPLRGTMNLLLHHPLLHKGSSKPRVDSWDLGSHPSGLFFG